MTDEDWTNTPSDVAAILDKLDESDREKLQAYIEKLQKAAVKGHGTADRSAPVEPDIDMDVEDNQKDEDNDVSEEVEFPPLYESGEDYEKASDFKQAAADCKDAGDWNGALEQYTNAILAAPPSALLYANRAMALVQLGRLKAAERDCNEALKENPDSAKALRIRGKVRKEMKQYEAALKDLSQAQTIDFDEGTVDDLKFLAEKHLEAEREEAANRLKGGSNNKWKKQPEPAKKTSPEPQQSSSSSARAAPSAMPGAMPAGMGGMPGGMDMGGLASMLMSDPELVAAMQKPKVQQALQEVMSGPGGPMALLSNPAKLQELMADPEVGPVLQKLMAKFGAGGMGAGMPGGGARSSATAPSATDDDDIPDLPDLAEF